MVDIGGVQMETPSIFLPMVLRKGSKYRKLSRYIFSVEEKEWVCHTLMCPGVDQQRNELIEAFSLRYALCESGLRMWFQQHEYGEIMYASQCFAQHATTLLLDEIAVAAVNNFPSTRGANENQGDYENRFKVFLNGQLSDTIERQK